MVLIASLVLVIVFTLWGKPNFLRRHLEPVGAWLGVSPGNPYYRMLPYVYWAVTSVALRVAVPLAIIVWVLHRRPTDFGYRLRGVTSHAWLYLLMFVAMIPLALTSNRAGSSRAAKSSRCWRRSSRGRDRRSVSPSCRMS